MAKKQLTERMILMDKIDEPGGIVRMTIDPEGVKRLADSIAALGLLQAILVRPAKDRFEIIYGHRRFLACRICGMKNIRATVKELNDTDAAMMRAAENVDREDITPIEEAAVYKDLRETHGLKLVQIANRMGKSESIIKRRLDLLRMPVCLQKAIHKKQISFTVGEVLWQLGDEAEIEYLLGFAIENGATRATVHQWVKDSMDKRRRKETTGEGGRGWQSPMESRPVYVPCDLCQSAMEIGEEKVMRACPTCATAIQKVIETTQK